MNCLIAIFRWLNDNIPPMGTGIDPKNDYAFKRVFGSERHTNILVHLLNAVLDPPQGQKIVAVQILNPITGKESLDEKTLILDIKARDERGRHFIVEMQMVIHPGLPNRFLLYWAKTYSGQLRAGEDYTKLQPTISICFVDRLLFAESDKWRLRFQISEIDDGVPYSDHLQIHVFQLPRFVKTPEELSSPLEKWLYFLNNGKELNPEDLPASLAEAEYHEAARTLQMLSQDEIEKARYMSRQMGILDAHMRDEAYEEARVELEQAARKLQESQRELEESQRELEESQHKIEESQHRLEESQHRLEESQHRLEESKHELEKSQRELEQLRLEMKTSRAEALAEGQQKGILIGQIRAGQQLLGRPVMSEEELAEMALDDLQNLANQVSEEK